MASLLKRSPLHGGEDEVGGEGLLTPNDDILARSGVRLAGPLSWRLTVRSTGGDDDFLLDGEVFGKTVLECRRCLSEVETMVATDLLYPMAYRPGNKGVKLSEDKENAEILVFGQPEVDFADLLTEIYAVDLPLTALCKEACLGLSADGINLNEHPEAKEKADTGQRKDSPFNLLKDLEL